MSSNPLQKLSSNQAYYVSKFQNCQSLSTCQSSTNDYQTGQRNQSVKKLFGKDGGSFVCKENNPIPLRKSPNFHSVHMRGNSNDDYFKGIKSLLPNKKMNKHHQSSRTLFKDNRFDAVTFTHKSNSSIKPLRDGITSLKSATVKNQQLRRNNESFITKGIISAFSQAQSTNSNSQVDLLHTNRATVQDSENFCRNTAFSSLLVENEILKPLSSDSITSEIFSIEQIQIANSLQPVQTTKRSQRQSIKLKQKTKAHTIDTSQEIIQSIASSRNSMIHPNCELVIEENFYACRCLCEPKLVRKDENLKKVQNFENQLDQKVEKSNCLIF